MSKITDKFENMKNEISQNYNFKKLIESKIGSMNLKEKL